MITGALNGKANSSHTHLSSDVTDLIDVIYPVGSIYMSVNSVNPATLFGGEWEQIKDKFLLSSGDVYTNGATGGEATHTLTTDEMPSHNHNYYHYQSKGSITRYSTSWANQKSATVTTEGTGGGQPHNNMPPYLAVNVWKRTA